jgi:hypothetical protein
MKKIFYRLLLLIAVVTSTSCSNSFFDINDDPNNPVNVGNEFVLTSGIAESAYNIGGYYLHLGGFWSQHYTQSTGASQWLTYDEFSLDENDFDRQWRIMYAQAMMDLQVVRDRSLASSDWSYYLTSTLVQCYDFGLLADLYGQIPFTEALKGVDNFSPKYEQGAVVTDSLIARIDKAMSQNLSATTVSVIRENDLVFQGKMDKWVKFGNTLKLKLMLRFVNVDANKYASQIQALLAENNFLNVSATMVAFKDEQDNRNPFYETFLDRLTGNVVASKTLLDTLQNASDDRLPSFFLSPVKSPGAYVGLGQGRYKADQALYANIQNLSTPNFGPLDPVYFFTLPEVDFLVAEAQLRYGTVASAQAAYIKGINDSYALQGVTAQPALYATGGAYEYKGLESIITQKWIAACNHNACESFIDFNRTGYPNFFVQSAISSIAPNFPQRILFPDSERKSNKNTPTRISIDVKSWYAK